MEINANRQTNGNGGREFDFSTSDFAMLLKTKTFVDKTLIIRDIFMGSSKILITAPPRFGKSTNIDMIKRFLEIEVDTQCTSKVVHTTKNYKLFKDNNLAIFKHNEFFRKHFGKHPVIHVDLEPVCEVRDFEDMLVEFRNIILKSFSHHSYLLSANTHRNSTYWVNGFDINDFEKYLCIELIQDVDPSDLMSSLEYLSTIVWKHFGKEVVVLIDNCDAFIKTTLSRRNNHKDTEKIISFINAAIVNLLDNERCVEQAILTGVFPDVADVFNSNGCYIECYSFMGNHPFCKYFGLTSDEIDNVLLKLELDEEERSKTKLTIDELYKSYSSVNRNVQVYNIWLVFLYICGQVVQNYRVYIKCFEPLFENYLIRHNVALALMGQTTHLDLSETLSMEDILELNQIIRSGQVENAPSSIAEKLFHLFYHFGYFSIQNALPNGIVSLQIANENIKYELASFYIEITHTYRQNYKLFHNLWSSIESFRPEDADPDATFKAFGSMINTWHREITPDEHAENGIVFLLYIIILAQTEHNRSLLLTTGTAPNDFSRILVKNKHDVIICITISCTPNTAAAAKVLMTYAEAAHNKVTALGFDSVFDKYTRFSNKVIVSITSKVRSSGTCIAYSYYFREGDSLENYKTLAVGFNF